MISDGVSAPAFCTKARVSRGPFRINTVSTEPPRALSQLVVLCGKNPSLCEPSGSSRSHLFVQYRPRQPTVSMFISFANMVENYVEAISDADLDTIA